MVTRTARAFTSETNQFPKEQPHERSARHPGKFDALSVPVFNTAGATG